VDSDFRDFVEARSPALLRTAYLLTGNRADAEDLLQDALLRLSRHWTRLEQPGSPTAYVRRTMVNLRTSRWRRRSIQTVTSDGRGDQAGPEDATELLVDRDEMWTALATLPPRMRAVLVLRFYEDRSEADTAADLGCSVGTVKSTTHRALAKLREALPERASQC
jgi:RNA polymerase sigma-70 factor (sigma-E family)